MPQDSGASPVGELSHASTCRRSRALVAAMLDRLRRQVDLVGDDGRQRTDATRVQAARRDLNRMELAGKTLRAALEALAVAAPGWLAAHILELWYERYGARASDYRLPQATAARGVLAAVGGADDRQPV